MFHFFKLSLKCICVVPPVSVAIEENRYSTFEGGDIEVCVTAENNGDEEVEVIVSVHIDGKSWSFWFRLH